MIERRSKEEQNLETAELMPGPSEEKVAEACLAAGVLSRDELAFEQAKTEVLAALLELEGDICT